MNCYKFFLLVEQGLFFWAKPKFQLSFTHISFRIFINATVVVCSEFINCDIFFFVLEPTSGVRSQIDKIFR